MATAQTDPMNANGEPESLSQPKCAAQATTAGAVSDRSPATTPIPNANARASPAVLIERSSWMFPGGVPHRASLRRQHGLGRRGRPADTPNPGRVLCCEPRGTLRYVTCKVEAIRRTKRPATKLQL